MSAEASKRASAGGGASADTLYNQGVISWNANDFPKAQEFFAGAVAANPNHAEAHFMLGQAYLNLGKLAEAAKEFDDVPQGRAHGKEREAGPVERRHAEAGDQVSARVDGGCHHCGQPSVGNVPDRRGRPPRRPGPVGCPAHRGFENLRRRSRPRRLGRRPA